MLRFDATRIIRNAEEHGTRILIESATDVLDISQQFVPVDKGELKASGKIEVVSPTKVRIGYTAEHAKYQEFGTSNSAAQPFLTPAMAQAPSIVKAKAAGLRRK